MNDSDPSQPTPVALITGAGSGIGRATAIRLAGLGYRLALSGRREAPLRETGQMTGSAEGTGWIAVPADVADPTQISRMVGSTTDSFDRLDALINNAGWTGLKPIEEHSADEVRRIFEINAMGPVWAICRALPIMLAQGGGVIVNVSSIATSNPFPGLSVYGAAKASCEAICLGIRNEHPTTTDKDIRAYCIAPGAVETPLLRSIVSEDMLPPAAAMSPEVIAREIVACVTGETDLENGQTRIVSGTQE